MSNTNHIKINSNYLKRRNIYQEREGEGDSLLTD